jgi:peptide-methionine (R)-S-oxide reductase
MDRRRFLAATTAFGLAPAALSFKVSPALAATEGTFEIIRTEAEWRAMLSEAEYAVLREEKTERAGSSPLDSLYDAGTYHCRGCDLALYPSATKFDSGTGWPSFWDSLPGAIGTKADNTFFATRTEAHCRRCGSHLGHIFDDGPAPTGLRHCLNGIALVFRAA